MDGFPSDYVPGAAYVPGVETSPTVLDPETGLFKTYIADNAPFTVGTVATDLVAGAKAAAMVPINAVGSAIDSVKTTARNTFLYLVGGAALLGILALLLMGSASRFAGKVGA